MPRALAFSFRTCFGTDFEGMIGFGASFGIRISAEEFGGCFNFIKSDCA